MMPVRALMLLAVFAAGPVLACNPHAPVPPILEGYEYDPMAAEALVRDAASIVTARFASTVETDLGNGSRAVTYVFDVIEGWKAVEPRRLAIDGTWVSCNLDLNRGNVFLLYLDGTRLLWAVPGTEVNEELSLLGDVDWFYGPSGQLVRPVERE